MAQDDRYAIEQRVDDLMNRLVRSGDLALLHGSTLKVLVAVLGGLDLSTGGEPHDAWVAQATGLTREEVAAARVELRAWGYLPLKRRED